MITANMKTRRKVSSLSYTELQLHNQEFNLFWQIGRQIQSFGNILIVMKSGQKAVKSEIFVF